MKTVYIVGAGMNAQSITKEGMGAINSAEVLFGAPRLLEAFAYLRKPAFPYYKPDDILREIGRSEKGVFTVLVSGDPGFFSGAARLYDALKGFDTRLVPGISCVNFFSARLGVPWQGFKFVSMHGAGANITDHVRRNFRVLCLTGGNAAETGRALDSRGLGEVRVYAGENLGYANEKITELTARDLGAAEFAPLTVLLMVNEKFDARARSGITDGEFARADGVPMTKCEVRAVISSKLSLPPGAVCYDIGAGTGSVTVEMALAAYDGRVFAIEQNENALPLISENLTRFNVGNVTVVQGRAPAALEGLPPADAAFIGGSGGEPADIIACLVRRNAGIRIVASAVTLESAAAALTSLEKAFRNTEVVQINAARAMPAGNLHMMAAQNPVTILSGGGV